MEEAPSLASSVAQSCQFLLLVFLSSRNNKHASSHDTTKVLREDRGSFLLTSFLTKAENLSLSSPEVFSFISLVRTGVIEASSREM